MTEVEKKALALVNEAGTEWSALCRAIEAHEADKQAMSEAVERAIDECGHDGLRRAYIRERFSRFILPKPDPLVEALKTVLSPQDVEAACNALAARGLEVRKIEEDA